MELQFNTVKQPEPVKLIKGTIKGDKVQITGNTVDISDKSKQLHGVKIYYTRSGKFNYPPVLSNSKTGIVKIMQQRPYYGTTEMYRPYRDGLKVSGNYNKDHKFVISNIVHNHSENVIETN